MALGLVAQAKLDGIQAELLGQLVHGAFKAEHPHRFAGRPHGPGHGDIHARDLVAGQAIRRRIEAASEGGGVFDKSILAGAMRRHLQGHGGERAVGARPQAHALYGRRPVDRGLEHLLAREGHFHGPAAQFVGRQRRQRQVLVAGTLAAEATADIAAHQVHLGPVDLQGLGQQVLRALD